MWLRFELEIDGVQYAVALPTRYSIETFQLPLPAVLLIGLTTAAFAQDNEIHTELSASIVNGEGENGDFGKNCRKGEKTGKLPKIGLTMA